MKRHAVLVALAADHSDLDIATFLTLSRSFIFKLRKQLSDSDGGVASVAKRKKTTSSAVRCRQDDPSLLNDVPSKSTRAITKQLEVE